MNRNELDLRLDDQLRNNANWYLAAGISLVIIGLLAVSFACTSTLFSVIYLGFLLIVVGILEGVHAVKINRWNNSILHGVVSILYIVGGIFMLLNPCSNALSLTLLLAFFFIVSGIAKIFFALTKNVPHQGVLVFNGIVSCLLGGMIWYQWPASGLWVLGTFVGFEALLTGFALIMLSYKAKRLKPF